MGYNPLRSFYKCTVVGNHKYKCTVVGNHKYATKDRKVVSKVSSFDGNPVYIHIYIK